MLLINFKFINKDNVLICFGFSFVKNKVKQKNLMIMKRLGSYILIILITTIISISISHLIWTKEFKKINETNKLFSTPIKYTSSVGLPTEAIDFTVAAETAVKAVVHVKTTIEYTTGSIFDFFFGYSEPQVYSKSLPVGSGVIVSSDGYIVTNNHVISSAENIEVTLYDKRTFHAKLIATDPSTDIALLKIDATDLPFLSFGNSDELRVGEWVLAVGNPFNLTSTVTAGIVSAKARNIGINSPFSIEAFIQTDAAVNPGNSGGALVNTRGELVGINTAIASQTGSYIGYSFAIPSNIVKKVVSDFIKYGEVQRAYLGVNILPIDQNLAKEKNLNTLDGVYIQSVYPNSAAYEAGIEAGDIIVAINDHPVKDIPQMQEQLGQFEPGQKITVTILRDNKKLIKEIVLKNTKNTTDIIKNNYGSALGAKFQTISKDLSQKLRIPGGAQIIELSPGILKSLGIQRGFIITAINRQPIKTAEDAELLLKRLKGNITIEGVYLNGMYAYYSFYK